MSYPTNPTTGDTHILSGKTWKYDGTNWLKLGFSPPTSTPDPVDVLPDVVFPSDWASPTSTYTSSGVWSKGALSDDDYVWFYLIGGGGGGPGGGGGSTLEIAGGGEGGGAVLLYGKASVLDGCSYVVGAVTAGSPTSNGAIFPGSNETTVTLSTANGSRHITTNVGETAFTYDNSASSRVLPVFKKTNDNIAVTNYNDFILSAENASKITFAGDSADGVDYIYHSIRNSAPFHPNDGGPGFQCIFGGGNGGSAYPGYSQGGQNGIFRDAGLSQYAGNGGAYGATNGSDGTAPGGGGGGGANGSGGDGARGEVRVYHV